MRFDGDSAIGATINEFYQNAERKHECLVAYAHFVSHMKWIDDQPAL